MERYMAIIGIVMAEGPRKGEELDYCREEIFEVDNESDARAKAQVLMENAPQPEHGTLFVRRIETWN